MFGDRRAKQLINYVTTQYVDIQSEDEAGYLEPHLRALAATRLSGTQRAWLDLNLVQCIIWLSLGGRRPHLLLEGRSLVFRLLDAPPGSLTARQVRDAYFVGFTIGRLLDNGVGAASDQGGDLLDELIGRAVAAIPEPGPRPDPLRARVRYEQACRLLDFIAENLALVDATEARMTWVRGEFGRMLALADESLWFADATQQADLARFVAETTYFKAVHLGTVADWDQVLSRLPSLARLCTTEDTRQAIRTVEGSAMLERALVEDQEDLKLRWLDSAAAYLERESAVGRDEDQRSNQRVQLGRAYVMRAIIRRDVYEVDRGLATILEAARVYTDLVSLPGAVGWVVQHGRAAVSAFSGDPTFPPHAAEWLDRWRRLAVDGLVLQLDMSIAAAKSGTNREEVRHAIRFLYDAAIRGAELLVELGQLDDAVVLLERCRLVALGMALDIQRQDSAARRLGRADLVERRAWLTRTVTALELALTSPTQSAAPWIAAMGRAEIADLANRHRAELDGLGHEIENLTRIDSTDVDVRVIRDAAARAPLLYVFATEEGGHAILVRDGSPTRHVAWASWDDQREDGSVPLEVVQQWREVGRLTQDTGRAQWCTQVERTVAWLVEAFARPLEPLLDPLDDLVLIPCGVMAELPLHAALLERPTGSPRTVRYGATARALTQRQHDLLAAGSTDRELGLLAIAVPHPQHAPTAAPLVTAEPLAARVRQAFSDQPTELLTSSEASSSMVQTNLPRYGLAHFSCHGTAEVDDPLSGGLELFDRRLTLREILDLRLPRARLAVVAACEGSLSGHPFPDELESVATGLVEAGFPGVIAGMWEVQERAMYHVLSRFYDELAGNPEADPARIFARAVHWLRTATLQDVEAYPVPGERPVRRVHPTSELLARPAYPDPDCWAGLAYYGL